MISVPVYNQPPWQMSLRTWDPVITSKAVASPVVQKMLTLSYCYVELLADLSCIISHITQLLRPWSQPARKSTRETCDGMESWTWTQAIRHLQLLAICQKNGVIQFQPYEINNSFETSNGPGLIWKCLSESYKGSIRYDLWRNHNFKYKSACLRKHSQSKPQMKLTCIICSEAFLAYTHFIPVPKQTLQMQAIPYPPPPPKSFWHYHNINN